MRKINIVLRLVFFIVLFSNVCGQDKLDTEGPIVGGFQNDTTARLLIVEWNKITGGMRKSYMMTTQDHHLAVIEVYTFAGKWIGNYIVNHNDVFLTVSLPGGIYFIKVGEGIRALFLTTGDKYEFLLY